MARGDAPSREDLQQSKSHLDLEFIATPEFDGPVKKRSCTDCLFLLLIITGWIAMTCKSTTNSSIFTYQSIYPTRYIFFFFFFFFNRSRVRGLER